MTTLRSRIVNESRLLRRPAGPVRPDVIERVLYERLRELTAPSLVRRDDKDAYRLTDLGVALGAALEPLEAWAQRWSPEPGSQPRLRP